jgi:hypothetical protein
MGRLKRDVKRAKRLTRPPPPPPSRRLVDAGGDWDRRNRLKVYRALHLLSIRQFSKAAPLLLDALPTFTATELIAYEEFVGLCVVAGVFALERKEVRKKVRLNCSFCPAFFGFFLVERRY